MRLRQLRIQKGLNQQELANILGVSGQTILNWENEIYEPSIEKLILIANYFNVSIDYLVERKNDIDIINELCSELRKIPKDDFIIFIKESLEKMK
ncbi:MAG: helix-turn-helix transcriptional regulator [Candidatus Onthovivens sp.]|nr:helix-turn-helix domain-containing protein [Mollicutes bacterium]MDY4857139.1 helix-turn-helix transcriptional regulator [Candidatus Onthovivens sp.]MDY4936640.1 helix-turn-helix transcriptional regulator [Candidatus Onthovivens sp.]